MAKRPDLVIMSGEMAGRRFAVGPAAVRLGRSSSNDIHVPDEELSRNHCLFEPFGETGLRVTDLASANGTSVNGVPIGSDPVDLKEGDVIEVGRTTLRVGDGTVRAAPVARAEGAVDLGLGSSDPEKGTTPAKRRSPMMNVLWAVAVLIACGAIALILTTPSEGPSQPAPRAVADETPTVSEVMYEKVKADSKGIFRFAMTFGSDGMLSVKIDDTANNRRMQPKRIWLSDEGRRELNEILEWKRLKGLERDYVGVEPDPPAADSQVLKVVYTTCTRTVRVLNTEEPEAFAAIREKLEAFSKSELGVWAIQYSRGKLMELAEKAAELGEAKWADRDVEHGNLAASIEAYREALFYLETIDPKPPLAATVREGLERSKEELDRRCRDQRFLADRALNLKQWEEAKSALMVLMEMVPDRRDDRHRDAKTKLLSAESHLKKGGER